MRVLWALWLVNAACSFQVTAGPVGENDGGGGEEGVVDDAPIDAARVRPGPGPCGKPGVLADDFSDGVAATFWLNPTPGAVIEQGGTLVVTPAAGSVWSGYRSDAMVDLRDAIAEVEVRTMVAGADVTANFQASHQANVLGFQVSEGELTASVSTSIVRVPYDPIAHRHWRIAEAGGSVMLSISNDGIAWTVLHTSTSPTWIRASTISVGGTNPASVAAPGAVTFAELSTYVAPATWCQMSTLSDAFNGDSAIGIAWAYHARTAANCSEYESNTAAHVDQAAGGACDAHYGSSALYSLSESTMVARITAIGTYVPGWITYLGAWDLAGRFVRLSFDQNQMCADGTGVVRTCLAYVSNQDLWRIRETGGTLFWETAQGPTPSTWRLVHSAPTPFDVTGVRAYFGTATDRNINTSIGLSVDRFN